MGKFLSGIYNVKNKSKYHGTKDPDYRSSWELKVFEFLDNNPNILVWGSETVVIPYYSKADARSRRYMVDLFIEYRNRKGELIRELVEIKPFAQTQKPTPRGNKKKETYLREVYTYQVNTDKWIAAAKFAKDRGMKFRILTEKDIFR